MNREAGMNLLANLLIPGVLRGHGVAVYVGVAPIAAPKRRIKEGRQGGRVPPVGH
jgi:hypothetical protein